MRVILLLICAATCHAQFVGMSKHRKVASGGGGGKVLINHTFAQASGTVTTSAINCTGANLIVMPVSDYGAVVSSETPTSSPANTWIALGNSQNGVDNVAIFYAKNANVSSSMTFTLNGNFPMIMPMCFSNADISAPFDQQAQSGVVSGTTCQAGSVTPGVNGEVIVAAFATSQTSLGTVTINSGLTKEDTSPFIGGTAIGGGDGYLVQSVAGAVNPQWSVSTESGYTCTVATFK